MHKFQFATALLLLAASSQFAYAATDIVFSNETEQTIQQIQQPYLDNFSAAQAAIKGSQFKFIAPMAAIAPHQSSAATISYRSSNWYGMSQYAYNYSGRSLKYGCFITQLYLHGFFSSKQIIVASYRKDPEHLDDYLICDVNKNSASNFTVHIKSTKASGDKVSAEQDDSKRYSMNGDTAELKNIEYYTIHLPVQLWGDVEEKKAFVIPNNQTEPTLVSSDSQTAAASLSSVKTIYVINLTNRALIAGPQIADDFSRLTTGYYIDQPNEIKANEIEQIRVAKPVRLRRFLVMQ